MSSQEIDERLKHNWNIMSEDMRNSYAPRPSFHAANLSFHLESPKSDKKNTSVKSKSKPQQQQTTVKTYSGKKRGRKPVKKANDFEKENTAEVDAEVSDTSDDDEEEIKPQQQQQTAEELTNNRRSGRKKILKTDTNNEVNNEKNNELNDSQIIEAPKRQSARMRSEKVPIKTQSRSASKKSNDANSISKLGDDTNNNVSSDSESGSLESEKSEKTDQKEIEDKEKYCGKCLKTGYGLVKV